MRRRYVIVVMLLLPVPILAQSPVTRSAEELFVVGNAFYEERHFDSAITSYAEALSQGDVSSALYFNLGNAYFKKGDLGHAILYYMRARRLDPSDDNVVSNLDFARGFASVQMEGVKLNPVADFLESLVAPYHLDSLAWLMSLFFVSLFVMMTLRFGMGFRNSAIKTTMVTCLSVTILMALLSTFKYRVDYLTPRAVVITKECPVYSGPNEQSELELEASPGLVVGILGEAGEYYNVEFENKRRGWLRRELVAVI